MPPPQALLSRASLHDVARVAGVSTATVSRVINGSAAVSDDKRQAVQRACDELGYVLNAAARTLASRRSMTIGAVVPTLATETFSRPLAAFQHTVHEAGYTLLVASFGFDEQVELKEVQTMLEHGVDALMVVGRTHDPKMWQMIDNKRIPCVQAWTQDSARPSVGFDNIAVSRDMVDHLLAFGHRRFAMLVNAPFNDRVSDRILGARARLAEVGLEVPEQWLMETNLTLEDGIAAMHSLLQGAVRPTAVICANDLLAFGALLAAKNLGVRVPEDVSVVGFNDFDYARHLSPPLTTTRVELEQIGTRAGTYLLEALDGKPRPGPIAVATELIVRGSSGPAPEPSG
ncbi:LacI family DNA-binding transcriptional regulator [Pseudomonas sp. KSR10]|jgi:LacI family transcriptional regulator|uniref:LacI family transcriptional regulator n=1 Tax=Stutzerimonas stutzeri TaxID=316 RepID=A0A0D9AGG2_STUST|nr:MULTISPECIES: LacI family DNA-binding transcriptional regulator [Pseudomonadaceae]KJH79774.1 LacI family transcriptional regulator [Stutzerimonas stutzeri]MCG6541403.1 LacI family DNA-binding transcriptional regulator [Pseudomonas sp. KSR10]